MNTFTQIKTKIDGLNSKIMDPLWISRNPEWFRRKYFSSHIFDIIFLTRKKKLRSSFV